MVVLPTPIRPTSTTLRSARKAALLPAGVGFLFLASHCITPPAIHRRVARPSPSLGAMGQKSGMNWTMGRLMLWIVLVVLALLIAGAGYLMFADVPAPVTTIEEPVPDAKLAQ